MGSLDEMIENVITKTFYEISNVYNEHKVGAGNINTNNSISHIVFPKYKPGNKGKETQNTGGNKDKTRISEQELRFVFVEKLNQHICGDNIYYSVETPTEKSYNFSKDGGPKVDKNGVSARTDLAIYIKENNEFKLKALIEFKAHNPDTIDYRKDVCKLINEKANNGCRKYFIQIINVKNQKRTLGNITDKIKDVDALKEQGDIDYCINYRCFNLYSKVVHKFIKGTIRNNKFEYTECELPSIAESTR